MTDETADALLARSGLPRLEARMLLELATGASRSALIAHGDRPVAAEARACFEALRARRAAGEPMAYLTGVREFHGRPFAVSPAVLIPRHETELLVEEALALAPLHGSVIDLGTGSGCIAVTLAAERADLRVLATDASPAAIEVARGNARRLASEAEASGRLSFRVGDWWAAVAEGERFDLAVSNPPYVAAGDPHLAEGDLRFEPRAALTDEGDGTAALRAIAAGAGAHLEPGGSLVVEHGHDQAQAVRAVLAAAGLGELRTLRDLAGIARLSIGRVV